MVVDWEIMDFHPFFEQFYKILQSKEISLDQKVIGNCAQYFYLLKKENEKYNLTGYKTISDFIDFHLKDTLYILNFMNPPENSTIMDIGTGAGIPGILMGCIRLDMNVILVESIKKKCTFLQMVTQNMPNLKLKILCDRAETLAHHELFREKYQFIVTRALGNLSQSLELTAGFVKVGGHIFLPRGTSNKDDAKHAEDELHCELDTTHHYSLTGRIDTFLIHKYRKKEALPEKYPRKPGQIKKHPL